MDDYEGYIIINKISIFFDVFFRTTGNKCVKFQDDNFQGHHIKRFITMNLLLRVNLDKIMHAPRDFDASSAQT